MYKSEVILSTGQVATLVGVSRETVKHWIFNGLLKTTLSNSSRWQVRESDLAEFLKAKQEALNTEEIG
jgi:excisionase family DNA binding protein